MSPEILNKVKFGDVLVKIDPRYFRPTEVDLLIGDPSKAQQKLGWKPKYTLDTLLQEMITSDIDLFKKDLELINAGHQVNFHQE